MNEKNAFVEGLKKRTKKFGMDVILFCESIKRCKASAVVTSQLVKAAISAGANYNAAAREGPKQNSSAKSALLLKKQMKQYSDSKSFRIPIYQMI